MDEPRTTGDEPLIRREFERALLAASGEIAPDEGSQFATQTMRRITSQRTTADLLGFAFAHLLKALLMVASVAIVAIRAPAPVSAPARTSAPPADVGRRNDEPGEQS